MHFRTLKGYTTTPPGFGDIIAPCKVAGIFESTGGKLPSSADDSAVIMEIEYFYQWISPYVNPDASNRRLPEFRPWIMEPSNARPYDFADYIVMNFPDPRIDYYKESDYDDVQTNVVNYVNTLSNKLGFFPASLRCAILEELQTLSLGLVFLGIIFSVISMLFIIISILLIYSLLMVTVEEKSFEIGIYRMVGLNQIGLVTMVLLKAFFFVIPAIIASFFISILGLWLIYTQMLDTTLGTNMLPLPTGLAVLYALGVGLLIPLLSSLIPLKIVLSKTLTDALDYAHSKTKAVYVKIMRAKDFDKSPYIIFGIISVAYGLSIYYFLPLSLISLNFGMLLLIFFMILIGMFVGMVLLALNLQRVLEILMVYLFLFYELTSTRMLVLKNLIAHKPRNRMTVCIYAMSIGFLIMIVVSYNLELVNARAMQRLEKGTYLHAQGVGSNFLTPLEFDAKLKPVSKYIEHVAWETFSVDNYYTSFGYRDIFASDDLALIQIPIKLFGVSPKYMKTLIEDFLIIHSSNDTSGLDLGEQLYTARGMQGAAMGGHLMSELSLDPNNWKNTFKVNLFTTSWNVYIQLRGIWSSTVVPSKNMNSRDTGEKQAMLVSIPTLKKLLNSKMTLNYFPFKKLLIKLYEPENKSHINMVTKQLSTGTSSKKIEIYDAVSNESAFQDAGQILDVVFNVIIASVMFLCFFSLSSSMTANMLEQRKEIGVLRAIGMRKMRIYFLYIYECFILIFTGCMTGILVGTMIGWTMMLQRVLFTNIPISFYFPWTQVIVIFIVSVVCAILATVFPAYSILKKEISQIFRSG